jgi:porin
MEQQLGKNGPLGLFMRAGTTNNALGAVQGATTSVAGGLVLNGPTEWTLLKTQQAYLAAGFYWLEAPYPAVAHQNEYGLEISYVMQLTETMTLQPDIQVIFDPANNTQSDAVAMFTLQVTYTW